MLDEENGHATVAQALDAELELADLLAVHARGGLVEQEQLRLGGERARELEAALLAEGEVRRELVVLVREAAEFEELRDLGAHPGLTAEPAREEAAPGAILRRVLRHPQVLPHREAAEEADVLEGARDAESQALVRRQAIEGFTVKKDFAARAAKKPGHDVHRRAFAGAVRADQADDLALGDREIEVIDRAHAAEVARHAAQLKHVPSRRCRAGAGSWRG